ncbi:PRC-barrel domain-containing protein [Microvirga sp. GCM10011540]|uniref:PRC-barrel domain-containing protein n=1 Tax=Microvirga sp. GCM10011540 TaxID=3317338 RepID=UPI0036188D1E
MIVLQKTSNLIGHSIRAKDGEIGSVADLLFEDDTWAVRWLVVDTGGWLLGRKVLLPADHLGSVDVEARAVSVDFTKEQVEESPGTGIDLPVSRQMETSIYDHYGMPPYWPVGAGAAWVPPTVYTPAAGHAAPTSPPTPLTGHVPDDAQTGDPHLRSASEVTGYDIHGSDDQVGHVEDFLVDTDEWIVRYVIVDTKNWWPGKQVIVPPKWVEAINWEKRAMRVARTRDEIKNAPEYDPWSPVDRDYETRLYSYYRMPVYWTQT